MTDRPPLLRPYARQSMARIGESRDTSLSLQAQISVIEDWATANGFVVAAAIRDHDLKGDDPNRPGLAELEASAQPGDTVAVYKFDRLARDVVLQESLVRRLQARNVQVISVTEPSTRLTRVIYGAVNEEFRDALSQRIKDARKQQAMRGHYTGAGTPYGYQRSQIQAIPLPDGGEYLRPTGVLTIAPTEAAIVREAFERVAAGESMFSIVVDFNARGIPTRRQTIWQVTTLRRMIANRWYYGAATYRGDEIATGLHEPIVSRDLWERAGVLAARPARRKKESTVTSWLEGYVAHACGRRMYLMSLQHHRNRLHHTEHFACQSAYSAVKCDQPRRHVSQRKLEPAVRECLAADLSTILPVADAFAQAVAVAGGRETMARRLSLEEKRARVLSRYDRVRDAWASGLESVEWLADEQAKRDTALADLDAQLLSLPVAPDRADFERVAGWLHTIGDYLDKADDGHLTALLAELGTVVVAGDGVSIRYDPAVACFVVAPRVAVVG